MAHARSGALPPDPNLNQTVSNFMGGGAGMISSWVVERVEIGGEIGQRLALAGGKTAIVHENSGQRPYSGADLDAVIG